MGKDRLQSYLVKQKMKDEIIQANYMIYGLEYHFSNIKRLYSDFESSGYEYLINCEEITRAIKHEVVAYLNRLGQFYAFAKSQKVKDLVHDPLSELKFIQDIIIFRRKQTAHRASDDPRPNDKNYDIESLDSRFSYGTVTIGNTVIFDIYNKKKKEVISFDPLKDNDKVMLEIKSFFEKLNSKIYEEDNDILNGEVCKWLINELYEVMFFAEGDNRLDMLSRKNPFEHETLLEVISHLSTIEWIFQHNEPQQTYLLKYQMLEEMEKRGLIEVKSRQLVEENKRRVLEALYIAEEHGLTDFSCKLLGVSGMDKDSSSFIREDLGEGINFMAFYKRGLKESGYLTRDFKLTKLGRNRILESKKNNY